jgi:hypothetical protein
MRARLKRYLRSPERAQDNSQGERSVTPGKHQASHQACKGAIKVQ